MEPLHGWVLSSHAPWRRSSLPNIHCTYVHVVVDSAYIRAQSTNLCAYYRTHTKVYGVCLRLSSESLMSQTQTKIFQEKEGLLKALCLVLYFCQKLSPLPKMCRHVGYLCYLSSSLPLTLIRMTKDEKVLAIFKGLLL
jgi:hypothetical protein